MKHNLDELKKRMPDAIRDVDYFNHIVIHQNDEIIRLLKKIANEEDKLQTVLPLTLEQEVEVEIQEEKPKIKRKKTEV